MANVYWYGDTGNWSDHANHWSNTSGGAGGADPHGSVPGAGDNVFFDANSFTIGAQTVTMDEAGTCYNFDWTNATNSPTFDMANDNLAVYGHFTLIAAMTFTVSGEWVYFHNGNTPNIITTAGHLFIRMYFQSSGSWQLADALTVSGGSINPNSGTLDTNGQTVTHVGFNISGTANVILGASTITSVTGDWNWTSSGSLTANTSTIVVGGVRSFKGGGKTYYNVELSGTAHTITGSNAFSTLTLQADTTQTITFTDGTIQTITTPVFTGSSGKIKTLTGSSTAGWTVTKVGGGEVTCDYMDIGYSTGRPQRTWIAGVNSTDTIGNTGWLFGRDWAEQGGAGWWVISR